MLEKLTRKKNRKGFTLVELIVVIAILGILMLIAVPRFAGFRESAAIKADVASAANIGKAAELYLSEGKELSGEDNSSIDISQLKAAGLLDKDEYEPQSKRYEDDNGFSVTVVENNSSELDEYAIKVKANTLEVYPEPEEKADGDTGGTSGQ